jgi:hypothetical protein
MDYMGTWIARDMCRTATHHRDVAEHFAHHVHCCLVSRVLVTLAQPVSQQHMFSTADNQASLQARWWTVQARDQLKCSGISTCIWVAQVQRSESYTTSFE